MILWLDPNALIYVPYARVNCLKPIPFTAAHTFIAYIWQYPPSQGFSLFQVENIPWSICVLLTSHLSNMTILIRLLIQVHQLVEQALNTSSAQLISESYNNSYNRVKITPRGGVTIFGVKITPKRSYFFL